MDFYAIVDAVIDLVRARTRVSFPALAEQFGLDGARLDALRAELRYTHAGIITIDDSGLTWAGGTDAERRQLTVLFCDLVDSTPLFGAVDPEDLREVMRAYFGACDKVIARYDGYTAQYLGDGLLVFFGYPLAHEDDAPRAVRAGLGIIEAITGLNTALQRQYGLTLAVRLGCHTGTVVVGEVVGETRHEQMALGDTPNIAARLQAVAEPNTLVIGELTHRLLHGFFHCTALGSPPLKGVAEPLALYQVLGEDTTRTRLEVIGTAGTGPLVGRTAELLALQELWAQTVAGSGRAVLIRGEAGIGKTRLVYALTERTGADHGWLVPCQASPYHRDTALYPFADLLDRLVLRPDGTGSTADSMRNLEGFLVQNGLALDDALPAMCALSGLPTGAAANAGPEQLKQGAIDALTAILLNRAARQPVLLVVEDLHWADPTTIELLTLLIEKLSGTRLLILLTGRPEFASPWAAAEVRDLTIDRLVPAEATELTSHVAGSKPLPGEILDQVVTKTDGVPLFIEEMTKTVLGSGLLTERTDHYELTGPIGPLAIPDTLHDSLMARLDQLSAVKGLAQLGAVLGRDFSYTVLRAVAPWDDGRLRDGLDQLVDAEFLIQQGNPPQALYRFKHALIQDAAYQSLLKSTRQQHHQRIAQIIEKSFPEISSGQPELLAHHYSEAGLTTDAIPYWYASGQRALQRYAHLEAANHARRGLELLLTLPESTNRCRQELALQLMLGHAVGFVHGPHSPEHIYARARELAHRVGSTPELFPALSGFAYAQIVRGNMHDARALAEEFLELALPLQDPTILAVAHWILAYTAWWQGDFADVRKHSRTGLGYYRPEQQKSFIADYGQDPGIVCGYLDALSDWVLGYPEQAEAAMERTLARATEQGHPYTTGIVLLFAAQLAQLRRDPLQAMVRADEAIAISVENGLHAIELWCLLPRGWALAEEGDTAAGIADIREAMARREAAGIGAVWPWFLAVLADVYGRAGQTDDGLKALDEAQAWERRNDERLYAAEVRRIRGELLRDADPDEAQRCFQQALEIARAAQAKSWELRAATSLARMWLRDGRPGDAKDVLLPVYDWFTEGFGTPDLVEARELLAVL